MVDEEIFWKCLQITSLNSPNKELLLVSGGGFFCFCFFKLSAACGNIDIHNSVSYTQKK